MENFRIGGRIGGLKKKPWQSEKPKCYAHFAGRGDGYCGEQCQWFVEGKKCVMSKPPESEVEKMIVEWDCRRTDNGDCLTNERIKSLAHYICERIMR